MRIQLVTTLLDFYEYMYFLRDMSVLYCLGGVK